MIFLVFLHLAYRLGHIGYWKGEGYINKDTDRDKVDTSHCTLQAEGHSTGKPEPGAFNGIKAFSILESSHMLR